ncbi:MAG: hypothetical protein AB1898_05100 [Acidobacteriota bacterium]
MPPAYRNLLRAPVILALAVIVAGLFIYRFANFREEGVVRRFLDELKARNYRAAYEVWGPTEAYTFEDFLSDWGKDGYYGPPSDYQILDSRTHGTGVIVYVRVSHLKKPLALWVERRTRTVSFSPFEEYQR